MLLSKRTKVSLGGWPGDVGLTCKFWRILGSLGQPPGSVSKFWHTYKIGLTHRLLCTAVHESLQRYTVDLDWDAECTNRISAT